MTVTAIRDLIINTLLGIPSPPVLNTSGNSVSKESLSVNLAADIKQMMSAIQAEAISDDGSRVDYRKIKTSHAYAEYRELVDQLHGFELADLSSRSERLAFWINIYNALVIDAVIQEEVKQSVTESWLGILSFFQKAAYGIDGMRFSLSDIEHGILRENRGTPFIPGPQFSSLDDRMSSVIEPMDPRIHFALNCASASCPPIQFYTPAELNQKLDLATSNFINQDLRLDKDSRRISISRIFSWYRIDFGGNRGILSFIAKHIHDQEISNWIKENMEEIRIAFQNYDWTLNRML